jgi:hypothetical protein
MRKPQVSVRVLASLTDRSNWPYLSSLYIKGWRNLDDDVNAVLTKCHLSSSCDANELNTQARMGTDYVAFVKAPSSNSPSNPIQGYSLYKHQWAMIGCGGRNELLQASAGSGISIEECAARCDADASCVSIEVSPHTSVTETTGICQLSTSCTYNLNLKLVEIEPGRERPPCGMFTTLTLLLR